MQAQSNPYSRNKTRYRGITYRVRADGTRTYSVYHQGKQLPVEGGETEAKAKQAELRRPGAPRIVTTKRTLAGVAEDWYATKQKQGKLRPRVAAGYRASLDSYLLPALGTRKLASLTMDDVAELIADLDAQGLSGWTVRNHLKPLRAIFKFAIRRGMASYNPVDQLEVEELPTASKREVRIPTPDEIRKLLAVAGSYRPLLELAIFVSPRKGELLGLEWQDFDREDGSLMIERQWTPDGRIDAPKTEQSRHRIPLEPGLVKMLSELRLRSRHSADEDPIFATRNGTRLGHRNAHRAWVKIKTAAGVDQGLRFHDLRHAATSMMIDQGLTPVEVADAGGWADPNTPLRIYSHLWRREETDERVRAAQAGARHA